MAVASTFDHNVTRNEIIEQAYRNIGQLALGESLPEEQLTQGILLLNNILKQLEAESVHVWTISAQPTAITLVANTFVYTTANDLPSNIKRLVTVSYRNGQAHDKELEILTAMQYERIYNKTATGDPQFVYLTEHRDVGSQTLFVSPMLSTVNTQSVVTGTDANDYRCIRGHTADTTNRPITGANYLLYWELGGSGGSAWADGTDYDAPQQLRLWFERPLFDFDNAADNPDVPQEYFRYLVAELAYDLSDPAGLPAEERRDLGIKSAVIKRAIRPAQVPKTNSLHNKALYF